MEYYSAIKTTEILPFTTTWMDLEIIMLSEISQTGKDKYCMLSLICGIIFLATPRVLRDLSSPTRDRTQALAVKVASPNHWTAREFPICGILKIKQTSEYKKIESDSHIREQTNGYQWGEEREKDKIGVWD